MKKMSIIGAVIVVIALVGVWFMFRGGSKTQTIMVSNEALQANILPVIQIINPSVAVLGPDGKLIRELADGEALTAPLHIQLGPKADAIIIYVDGSSARLSAGTDIKLERGLYDTNTGTINSKISLLSGHVWSKVEALATPEAQWQVETPHAVATVRGTAFDSKVEDGKSTFTGSEHTVKIVPIDPDTGEEMTDKDADLNSDKQIVLGDDDMHKIKDDKAKIEPKKFATSTAPLADRDWIDQNTKRDAVVDDIKDTSGDDTSIRDKMLQEVDRMKDDKNTDDGSRDTNTPHTTTTQESKQTEDTSNAPTGARTGGTTETTETVTPVKMLIRMAIPKPLVEGTKVPYSVIAVTADGTEVDWTRQVKVHVEGGIGTIPTPGIFVAKIADDKTELGTVPGALSGQWTNPKTGATLEFSTPIFNVSIFIEQTTDTRG